MFRKVVTTEQPESLVEKLAARDIAHGDVAEDVVLEGVGVGSLLTSKVAHLAFCPARVASIGSIARASQQERELPMPRKISLSRSSCRKLVSAVGGKYGFATLRCRIWGNGSLNIENIDVLKFTPVRRDRRVNHSRAYDDFRQTVGT